jgi:hypothetical protein
MRATRLYLLLLLILLTISACQKKETTPPAAEPQLSQTTQTAVPAEITPITDKDKAWIEDVTIELGSGLDPDGSLAVGKATSEFKIGDPAIVSMDVGSVPANTPIKVVWVGPNEKKVSEETKSTAAGQKYLTFTAPDTKSWANGEYRAEVWFGDKMVSRNVFKIA